LHQVLGSNIICDLAWDERVFLRLPRPQEYAVMVMEAGAKAQTEAVMKINEHDADVQRAGDSLLISINAKVRTPWSNDGMINVVPTDFSPQFWYG
jgi:hypothetical protein